MASVSRIQVHWKYLSFSPFFQLLSRPPFGASDTSPLDPIFHKKMRKELSSVITIAPESWRWDMSEKELVVFAAIVPPKRDITVKT